MSCFPCFSSQKSRKSTSNEVASREINASALHADTKHKNGAETKGNKEESNKGENRNIAAQIFTFRELATATRNFRQECLLGEGGFGRVYKGKHEQSGQIIAVKQLDRNGLQGNKEFLVEVLMLSLLHHPNLVNLIGYCADGEQRLLVYEYMSGGSLEDHLLDIDEDQKPLDWFTRMKIAFCAAKGLEYLHDKANPPVIYRDLKSSNILLDEDMNPKLSDFGLAKLGHIGDKFHVSSRVMGTYGYCAPEYTRTGQLTMKSDVYSFGVVLLELITGRRAIDTTRPNDEQNLVSWAQPFFRNPKKFPDLADPLLKRRFPERDLNQAVAIAAMCLNEEASARPLISDVVTAFSFLSMVPEESSVATALPEEKDSHEGKSNNDNKEIESHEHRDLSKTEDENQQSGENSDYDEDEDYEGSSYYDETGSEYLEDEEREDDRQQAVAEAKEWALNSSREGSEGSVLRSKSSTRKSSRRSQQGGNVSMRNKGTLGSKSSQSRSRNLQDENGSLSQKSSLKSQYDSVSSSRKNSIKAPDGNFSLSRNSSRRAQDINISLSNNSKKGLPDGTISSSHQPSRESEHESFPPVEKFSPQTEPPKQQSVTA